MKKVDVRQFRILLWMTLISIIATFFFTGTYSAYTSKITITGSEQVASVVVGGELSVSTSEISPTSPIEYTFKILNKNNGIISDVSQTYSLSISDRNNLPLQYSIKSSEITKGTGTLAGGFTNKSTTTNGILPNSSETSHTYTLLIQWKTGETDVRYADEIDMITINVNLVQVNPS